MEIHAREYLLDIPFWTKKKNTLEQVRAFLEELGNPDEELQEVKAKLIGAVSKEELVEAIDQAK